MNTAALRQLIAQARQQESGSQALSRFLQTQLERLHPSIRLPEEDAPGALSAFVIAYIEEVPDVLDAAAEVAREAGIEAAVKPVLKIAEHFFLQPPALMEGHEGLEGLLDEAYLAHRLVEEVNERYLAETGAPLIALDMTTANLVVHHLIGEPFANELDDVAATAAESVMANRRLSASEQADRLQDRPQNWDQAWEHWAQVYQLENVGLHLAH